MNNKPVAWIDKINTFVLNKDYKQLSKNLQNGMIPLYTHPAKTEDEGKVCARCGAIAYDPVITQTAKTLTDEEIIEMVDDAGIKCGDSQAVYFARAILRKAQEK